MTVLWSFLYQEIFLMRRGGGEGRGGTFYGSLMVTVLGNRARGPSLQADTYSKKTNVDTQKMLRLTNIPFSIHYEYFFLAREGLLCIVTKRFNLVHCVFNRMLMKILTNFDAFFEDKSFLHSFCSASSLTKNKLKSSNTCRESKILAVARYYEKPHCL